MKLRSEYERSCCLEPKTTKMPRLATILIALIGSVSLCIAPPASRSQRTTTPATKVAYGLVQVQKQTRRHLWRRWQVIEIPQSAECGPAAAPNSDITARRASTRDRVTNMRSDEWAPQRLRLRNYDPYWPCGTPAPIYYYSRGDGGHDCDGGNCRSSCGHGSHPKPPLQMTRHEAAGERVTSDACRRNTAYIQCPGLVSAHP